MFNVYIPINIWESDIDLRDPTSTFQKLSKVSWWCSDNLEQGDDGYELRGIAVQLISGKFVKEKKCHITCERYVWFAFHKKSDAVMFKLIWG